MVIPVVPFPFLSFLLFHFSMFQGSLKSMEELPLAILQDRQLLGELWRVGPGRMEVLARAIARRQIRGQKWPLKNGENDGLMDQLNGRERVAGWPIFFLSQCVYIMCFMFHVWNLRLISFWCHSFSSTNHDQIFLMTKELVTFVGPDCALMPLVRAPASPAKAGFPYVL